MSTATAASSGEELWQPKGNPWIIAVAVSLAAFMEVLDTSIANVALPHIAGNLGASNDESTWVLTSYLVSNAIVLPTSGWLVGFLGRKRFFLICIVFFTASSFLCGIAPSLGLLLLALDFLHQRSSWRPGTRTGLSACRRSPLPSPHEEAALWVRLHRVFAPDRRRRRLADRSRQGTGRRLVRISFHYDLGCDCRRGPRFFGNLGMVSERAHC